MSDDFRGAEKVQEGDGLGDGIGWDREKGWEGDVLGREKGWGGRRVGEGEGFGGGRWVMGWRKDMGWGRGVGWGRGDGGDWFGEGDGFSMELDCGRRLGLRRGWVY